MPFAHHPNQGRFTGSAAVFAGFGLLVLFVMVVPVGRVHPDDFYLGRVFMDLLVDGGDWRQWVPPSAPSFFPDGVLYGAIAMFTMDMVKVSITYAAVIALLTSAVLYLLGRVLGLHGLSALFTVMLVLLGFFFFGERLTVWSRPSQHFLTYFNFLLCNTLLLLALRRPALWVVLVPLIVIAVMSDYLFIPLFAASSLAMILVRWLQKEVSLSRGLLATALALSAVLAGAILYKVAIPNPQTNPVWASGLSLREALTSIGPHLRALQHMVGEFASIPFAMTVAAVVSAGLFNRRDGQALAAIAIVSAMFIAAIAANLYVVGLGSAFTVARPQYRILVLNGELTLFAFALGFVLHARPRWLTPSFALTGVAALALAVAAPGPGQRLAHYTQFLEEVNCIRDIVESHDLSYGLASFKESDRFTVLSDNRVSLNTVVGNRLRTKHYVLSRAWSDRLFDYALVENQVEPAVYTERRVYYPLSGKVVKQALGEPTSVHACKTFSVMIYDRKIACRPNTVGTHDCDTLL